MCTVHREAEAAEEGRLEEGRREAKLHAFQLWAAKQRAPPHAKNAVRVHTQQHLGLPACSVTF